MRAQWRARRAMGRDRTSKLRFNVILGKQTDRFSMAIVRAPFLVILIALFAAGCATVPGQNYPKEASTAFAHPETTKLGRQLEARAREHPDVYGFRLLVEGVDGFLMRAEMAN